MSKQDNISYWVKSISHEANTNQVKSAADLSANTEYDVSIIGGGFTGLWLAYYLKKQQPTLNIAIFEAHQVAYGASGRNGGWLSPHLPGLTSKLLKNGATVENVRLFQKKLTETIQEVKSVCQQENIDCDLHEGGLLSIALNSAQDSRLKQQYEHDLKFGFTESDMEILSVSELNQRIELKGTTSGLYYHQGARIQPAKLAFGLKNVVLNQGVHIYENSPVASFASNELRLADKVVKSAKIICCTEGYSDTLLKSRKVIPMNSSIIATQVLDDGFWNQFGWHNQELLADASHLFFYAQRTKDNRIVFGGRGAPYQYNSQTTGHGELDTGTIQFLYGRLSSLFPNYPFKVEHAWRGSLGLTRDWCPTITYNPDKQIGHIFGYAGHGVAGTNLAARTMAHRLLNIESELTSLPWNNYINPKWEPEPFRWIGIQTMYKLLGISDGLEHKQQAPQTTALARAVYKICGVD